MTDVEDKSLYFEIHVTIEPVQHKKEELIQLGQDGGDFRLATLLMRKGDAIAYEDDQFFTSRRKTFDESVEAVKTFCALLSAAGYPVKRYKIEDTRLDSKIDDQLNLCEEQ